MKALVDDARHVVVHAGRLHYVDLIKGDCTIRVVNAHVQEIGRDLTKEMIIDSIQEICNDGSELVVFLLGDFNATVTGEGRYCEDKGQ